MSDGAKRQQPLVASVVVTYGDVPGLKTLVSELDAIADSVTVIVENGVRTSLPCDPTGIVSGQGNIGYGSGVNLGYRTLVERGIEPEWLLICNSDLRVVARDLDNLRRRLVTTSAPIVAIRFARSRSTAVLPDWRSALLQCLLGEARVAKRYPKRNYPVGACFAIRTSLFLQLNGFDPDFWLYFEETDLFWRAISMNASIDWIDLDIQHYGGQSSPGTTILGYELGRSGAIFAHKRGWWFLATWSPTFLLQTLSVVFRSILRRHFQLALTNLFAIPGFLQGLGFPGYAPFERSKFNAAPRAVRHLHSSLLSPP